MTRRVVLNDEQVKEIRKEYMAYIRGYGYLAKKYNCGESTIRDICTYRTRANVKSDGN